MKREELETFYRTSCVKDTDIFFYSKDKADKVMDAMEARIKELEATISKMEASIPKWINSKDRLPCEDGEY